MFAYAYTYYIYIHTCIHKSPSLINGYISKPTWRGFEESRRHALLRPLQSGGAASVFTLRLGEFEGQGMVGIAFLFFWKQWNQMDKHGQFELDMLKMLMFRLNNTSHGD